MKGVLSRRSPQGPMLGPRWRGCYFLAAARRALKVKLNRDGRKTQARGNRRRS
jgi:hypothetical protein